MENQTVMTEDQAIETLMSAVRHRRGPDVPPRAVEEEVAEIVYNISTAGLDVAQIVSESADATGGSSNPRLFLEIVRLHTMLT